jgi:hypothetical protein
MDRLVPYRRNATDQAFDPFQRPKDRGGADSDDAVAFIAEFSQYVFPGTPGIQQSKVQAVVDDRDRLQGQSVEVRGGCCALSSICRHSIEAPMQIVAQDPVPEALSEAIVLVPASMCIEEPESSSLSRTRDEYRLYSVEMRSAIPREHCRRVTDFGHVERAPLPQLMHLRSSRACPLAIKPRAISKEHIRLDSAAALFSDQLI